MSSSQTVSNALSKALYEELGAAVSGRVYLPGDMGFSEYSSVFNGSIISPARAVVCPLDAGDVSQTLKFCAKHSLSPSIKAGGYGVAGWAVSGEIVLDMNKICDIDIETPLEGGKYTSIRDMSSKVSQLKARAGNLMDGGAVTSTNGKRRRLDDVELRTFNSGSPAVANFLKGPPLAPENGYEPHPKIRRRDESPGRSTDRPDSRLSGKSSSSSSSRSGSTSSASGTDSTGTSESSEPKVISPKPRTNGAGDPFGYLDDKPQKLSPRPLAGSRVVYAPSAVLSGWRAPSPGPTNGTRPYASSNFLSRAEPVYPHAYVTFGAGVRQKELDIYTDANPLESKPVDGMSSLIPYHVPTSAHPVGSSIMLLGGFGFLSRLHGLSIDNLVEAEVVLADGRIVIVNENEHPDLWWAIRGAGPAFGVATRYKARAFPVPMVYAGNLIYRFHRATAPSLIKHFRDCVKGAPRELYANVFLTAGPAGKDSLVVVQMCYIGSREKGQEFLQAISSWDGERCLLNEVDEKSFLHQQDSVAQILRGQAGYQWFIRSALINSLPDDIVNETVLNFADTPTGCTWLIELAGGAVTDREDNCFPKTQREARFTVAAFHQWEMGIDDPRCMSSAEEWMKDTLGSVNVGGPYPSFLGRNERAERTKACFGGNWDRLRELKRKYDPTNLFKNSFWPLDADGNELGDKMNEAERPSELKHV